MFVLILSDMRHPKYEQSGTAVARANTAEKLREFVASERVEPYRDDRFAKNFRKGGPLEWFNPPFPDEMWEGAPVFFDMGTEEDAEEWARQQFRATYGSLHEVE